MTIETNACARTVARWATVAVLALSLSACATVTRGTKESFTVNSDPAGARVAFSDGSSCTTPCTLKMKRAPGFTVTVSKEGYKTVTAEIKSVEGNNAALAGNLVLGGVVGLVVDNSNGSLKDLKPNPLSISLEKDDGSAPAAAASAAPAATPAPAATEAAPAAASPAQ